MYQVVREVCLLCGYVAHRRQRKRVRLSVRLHRIFFMDALEGQLDVMARRRAI